MIEMRKIYEDCIRDYETTSNTGKINKWKSTYDTDYMVNGYATWFARKLDTELTNITKLLHSENDDIDVLLNESLGAYDEEEEEKTNNGINNDVIIKLYFI